MPYNHPIHKERLPEITSQAPEMLRRYVRQRDGKECQYCGTTEADNYVVEHVVPQRRGGPHHPANLVVACWSCNRAKDNRIWRPMNFYAIAGDYPEWVAEVERLENPEGDLRKGGPAVTVVPPPVELPRTRPETLIVQRVNPQLILRARVYAIHNQMKVTDLVTLALTRYLDEVGAPPADDKLVVGSPRPLEQEAPDGR